MKRSGIRFETEAWGQGDLRPARVARHTTELSDVKFDYCVCATKADPSDRDQTALMQTLQPLVSKDTTIVVVQNGPEVERPFRSAFPDNTLISSICYIGCVLSGGVVRQSARMRAEAFQFGIYGHGRGGRGRHESLHPQAVLEQSRLKRLVALDARFKAVQDAATERWAKAVFNGAWNITTTLFGADTHNVMRYHPDGMLLARELAREVCAVASKYGAQLPDGFDEDAIIKATRMASFAPSTLQDARQRRQMEIESLCGE